MTDPDTTQTNGEEEEQPMDTTLLFQILTGAFAGLALILLGVTIWLGMAKSTGRRAPIPELQGGFSLAALGSLMSTS